MSTIDATGNIHDDRNGRFTGHVQAEGDTTVLTAPIPVGLVPVTGVKPGDTIWADGNPVEIESISRPDPWSLSLLDAEGRTHRFTNLDDRQVFCSPAPIAPFDEIDWTDAGEFDDWQSDNGNIDTTIRYNTDGYGQVATTLTGLGGYRFHAEHYLGLLGDFDPEEKLPDGRTKGEALGAWTCEVVMPAVDAGITERYGWEMSYRADDCDPEEEMRPLVWATNTRPGELDAETVTNLIWPAQARLINESDPGTFNAEYPYDGWIRRAVKERQERGEKALPW